MNKPYSESCDQNRESILAVIQPLLEKSASLLEIGSGTGQHAVYFADKLPHLKWYTSDCEEYLPGIHAWLSDARLSNIEPPFVFNVSESGWPEFTIDAVFSANTVHIMHWHNVEALFEGIGKILQQGGCFLLYGPFNYNQQYTSESNQRFDQWLKDCDSQSGIKHFKDLASLADNAGLALKNDYAMPANNRILHWRKI